MVERLKMHEYAGNVVNRYFWRTYDQKEIDLIEEWNGRLYGFEFKWKSGKMRKATQKEFLNAYPNAVTATISQDNFVDFLQA